MSGTKVTSDPASLRDAKTENPGVVTSDSLAAESINEGGAFAATSDARGPNQQPSSSTTTNTTDASNAVQLDAASSRAERDDGTASSATFGGPGVPNFSRGGVDQSAGSASDIAQSRPKGSGLVEGGEITGEEPNASFNNSIGGKNDPGRAALHKIEADNAAISGTAAANTTKLDSNTQYDALGGDTTS